MCQYAKQHGYTKIAILVGQDPFEEQTQTDAEACAHSGGLTVTGVSEYNEADTSFTSYLAKLQATHPQALFLSAFGTNLYDILKDKAALGWSIPLVGDDLVGASFTNGVVPPSDYANAVAATPSINVGYPPSQTDAAYRAAYKTFSTYVAEEGKIPSSGATINDYALWWDVAELLRYAADQAHSTSGSAIANALVNFKPPASAALVSFYPLSLYKFSAAHYPGGGGLQVITLNQLGVDAAKAVGQINSLSS